MDLKVSVLLIMMMVPVMAVIIILVKYKLGSPVIFRQLRPGLKEAPFIIYKFRTMTNVKNDNGELLSDGERVTKFGRFLRSTSLDELPELFNVIKGNMSIVGPRPLLMQYIGRYNKIQARRHNVKPGITGWAQVNGRNAISWQEKFKFDIWYVDNMSLALDLKIIILTIKKVLKCEGISEIGKATMSEFIGE